MIFRFTILLALSLVTTTLVAQIDWKNSSAQAITYWDLYDSVSYEVLLEKIKINEGDTTSHQKITYDVGVTVVDSTHNSYVIEWHYQHFEVEGADPFTARLLSISDDITVQIRTDELGTIQTVENWEVVRDYTSGIIDELLADMQSIPKLESIVENMKSMYATEAGVTNAAIQDAQQYHTFFGVVYELGEKIESPMLVPNLYFPDEPLRAKLKLELTDLDRELDSYFLRYEHVVNEGDLKQATYKYLEQMEMPKMVLDEIAKLDLTTTVLCESQIHNSGWVIGSRQVKETNARGSKELEIRTIVMK